MKEAALRQASCGADILDAGGVVALLPDDVERRIQNFEALLVHTNTIPTSWYGVNGAL